MPLLTITRVAGPFEVTENADGSAVQKTRSFFVVTATDGSRLFVAEVSAPYSTAKAGAALQVVYAVDGPKKHPDEGATVTVA